MKILLVDDEFEKSKDISAALSELGLPDTDMVHRSNAREAREVLRQHNFDLLLLDLNLPEMIGTPPKRDGGLALFDMLMLDTQINLPRAVIFITGKDDLYAESETEVANRGAQLCFYSAVDRRWRAALQAKLKYLSVARKRSGSHIAVDIVITTAMRSELEAVLKLPYEWRSVRYPGNSVGYNHGTVTRADGRSISVVAAAAFTKGMPSSAALAAQTCILFRPKYVVMLGICAGIKSKTSLGDVIVADPTWDWGSGKIAEGPEGDRIFLSAPQQRRLNTEVSELCMDLSEDLKVIREIRSGWMGRLPEGEFKVRVGPMASGASVLANGETVNEITSQNRDLIAIEMEAYAVMAAAEYSISPKPISIAIKSVCDFADSKKGDNWQAYAAYTSAAFFDQLLRSPKFSIDTNE